MQELLNRYWIWISLLTIILFTVAIRIRLLEVPLERDEGEYAYAGQLILDGVPPYAQVYNMKMPGIYVAYALILAIFGQTHNGIHMGLLVINAATIFVLFLIGKKLFDPTTAVVGSAAFGLLSLGQRVLGFSANAEHFVILPALGGILFLINAIDYRKWLSLLGAGVLLGLSFIMKQHGSVFIIFAGLYLLFSEIRRRPFSLKSLVAKGTVFLVGVLLPLAVTFLVLWWCGVFEKFWFWTFDYAREYVSAMPLSDGLKLLKMWGSLIVKSAIALWIFAGIGLTSLWWNKKARKSRVFVIVFLLFSFLAICPGFYFRPHYFILLLPAIALLTGIGASSTQTLLAKSQWAEKGRAITILLAFFVLFHTIYQQWNFFFIMSPTTASRKTYGLNPFPESPEIGRFIKEHSEKNERIAVIGSEPQIYFYSNRRSATGHIYTYALMEDHGYASKMQEEMIREIESWSPKFLVFVNVHTSWLTQADSKKLIFKWFQQYHDTYYQIVGIIDIISQQETVYRWGQESENYKPRSISWLLVSQRKK
ncbi:MAG: glycosyltransferase family 39 protein [Planctomycetota bacterium]|nr:MAG: glycosyltransferase family 39 protein [Planctomycetota bacterium]